MSECSISFPGRVSRTTVIHIAIEYMKYVLYYRGQFPLPLDQLKKLLNESNEVSVNLSRDFNVNGHKIFCDTPDRSDQVVINRSSAVASRTKQKFTEAVSNFDKFFDELSQFLEVNNVKEIVLNIGPNMMKPKELYRITLPKRCLIPECALDYAPLHKCKLQFFREIMQSDLWEGLPFDSVLPISVLLLLENGVSLSDHMEQKCFYALPRNCKQRTVHFIDQCNHKTSNLSCELEGFENMSVTDRPSTFNNVKTSGLWVKLKPDLRGIKSCSEFS